MPTTHDLIDVHPDPDSGGRGIFVASCLLCPWEGGSANERTAAELGAEHLDTHVLRPGLGG